MNTKKLSVLYVAGALATLARTFDPYIEQHDPLMPPDDGHPERPEPSGPVPVFEMSAVSTSVTASVSIADLKTMLETIRRST